jgi:hypothetical protein
MSCDASGSVAWFVSSVLPLPLRWLTLLFPLFLLFSEDGYHQDADTGDCAEFAIECGENDEILAWYVHFPLIASLIIDPLFSQSIRKGPPRRHLSRSRRLPSRSERFPRIVQVPRRSRRRQVRTVPRGSVSDAAQERRVCLLSVCSGCCRVVRFFPSRLFSLSYPICIAFSHCKTAPLERQLHQSLFRVGIESSSEEMQKAESKKRRKCREENDLTVYCVLLTLETGCYSSIATRLPISPYSPNLPTSSSRSQPGRRRGRYRLGTS